MFIRHKSLLFPLSLPPSLTPVSPNPARGDRQNRTDPPPLPPHLSNQIPVFPLTRKPPRLTDCQGSEKKSRKMTEPHLAPLPKPQLTRKHAPCMHPYSIGACMHARPACISTLRHHTPYKRKSNGGWSLSLPLSLSLDFDAWVFGF